MKFLKLILPVFILPVMLACSESNPAEEISVPKPDPVSLQGPIEKIKSNTLLVKTVSFDTTIVIRDGVKQYQIQYLNPDDQPLSLYILEVDLNRPELSIQNSMPNNSTTFALQTVPRIAQFEQAEGNHVLAAVNADYFLAGGVPWGAVIKRGTVLKTTFENSKHTWFGLDKTGAPLIGAAPDFITAQPNLQIAVGGKEPLVEKGFGTFNTNVAREPRTIVGYTDKKIVYLMVADGRQASHSIGMTLKELTQVMLALGAKEAINLDGGGSATFVVKNKEKGTYDVLNKPSDGSPRSVANALTVISSLTN
jgi:hypothetical protein